MMYYRLSFLVCLLSVLGYAAHDEQQLKPKEYVPRNTLKTNTYQAKTYSAKTTTMGKAPAEGKSATYKPVPEPEVFAGKPLGTSEAVKETRVESQPAAENKSYIPENPKRPISMAQDQLGASAEKKPFIISTNHSPFIITERPKERNPLLEPRQGIKAPQGDSAPVKDAQP